MIHLSLAAAVCVSLVRAGVGHIRNRETDTSLFRPQLAVPVGLLQVSVAIVYVFVAAGAIERAWVLWLPAAFFACLAVLDVVRLAREGEGSPCGCGYGGTLDRYHAVEVAVLLAAATVVALSGAETESIGGATSSLLMGVVAYMSLQLAVSQARGLREIQMWFSDHYRPMARA